MKTRTFNYYCDPAHGWVKVKNSLLKKLGIEREISGYSYTRGDYSYLEEDLDATTLDNALNKLGVKAKYKEFHTNKSSKIRSYNGYCAREIFGLTG